MLWVALMVFTGHMFVMVRGLPSLSVFCGSGFDAYSLSLALSVSNRQTPSRGRNELVERSCRTPLRLPV